MKQEKRADDFIMNPQTPPATSQQPVISGKRKRMLIVAAGGVLLLLVIGIVFSLFSSGGKSNAEQTLKLAQQHTEMLRVAEIGIKQSRSTDVRSLATTVKLTLQSSNDQIKALAMKGNKKVTDAELSAGKNTKTDDILTTAGQNNRFDAVFTDTIHDQIRAYLQQLRVVYDGSNSKKDKQTLDDIYRQLNKLLPGQST